MDIASAGPVFNRSNGNESVRDQLSVPQISELY